MIIGVPKEIKKHEYRVSVTPSGVRGLKEDGHRILVERSAGEGSGFSDKDYEEAGAEVSEKKEVFAASELIVKVKEPLPPEFDLFRENQVLFTFLHLASNPDTANMLLKKNITAFSYETLEVDNTLPLLKPMSEIAGKMAPVVGAYYLQKIHGGEGILVTGAGGVPPAQVLILGAGSVGMGALEVAHGMGAKVTVINRGQEKLDRVNKLYSGEVKTLVSTKENIETEAMKADILIGAVLVTGAKAPTLLTKALVAKMKKGSVIVDVSVDQGGCIETSEPTTHDDPIYSVEGVTHYTVANMPGAYPKTSTIALTNSTIEYVRILAKSGIKNAIKEDSPLKSALNTYQGKITHKAVARAITS
jgi:alanine dehydrogenase